MSRLSRGSLVPDFPKMALIVSVLIVIAASSIASAQAPTASPETECNFDRITLADAVAVLPGGVSSNVSEQRRHQVRIMQNVLVDIYGDREEFRREGQNLNDGLLGPRTQLWINRFCDDFEPLHGGGGVNALMQAFLHYWDIRDAYPDWAQRFATLDLAPSRDASLAGQRLRWQRSGPPAYAIDVLDAVAGGNRTLWQGACTPGTIEQVVRAFDRTTPRGEETDRAFTAFAEARGIKGSDGNTEPSLDAGTVGTACEIYGFGRMPSSVNILGDAIVQYGAMENAVPTWRNILDSQGFHDWVNDPDRGPSGPDRYRPLRRVGTAPTVIALLAEYLADRPDVEIAELVKACSAPRQPARGEDDWATYYKLGEDGLQQLDPPAASIAGLRALVGKNFSQRQLTDEVRAALTDLRGICPPSVFDGIVTGVVDEEFSGLVLDDRALGELAATRLPQRSLAAIALLKGVVFEDGAALRQAVRNRLATIQGAPPSPATSGDPPTQQDDAQRNDAEADTPPAPMPAAEPELSLAQQVEIAAANAAPVFQLTEDRANALETAWMTVAEDPALTEDQASKLAVISHVAYPNKGAFVDAITAAMNDFASVAGTATAALTPAVRDALVTVARRRSEEPFPAVTIATEGCGCAQSFGGLTYGIVPSWLGQEAAATGGDAAGDAGSTSDMPIPARYNVDFGLLNRIGYVDSVLTESGRRDDRQSWQPTFDTGGFIARAHRYDVNVDMIVRTKIFEGWNENERYLDTAVDTVIARFNLKRPRQDARAQSLFERVTSLFNVERFHNTRLDGVTLLLEDFGTQDGETTTSQGAIVERFVEKLRATLDENNPGAFLNLGLAVKPERAEQTLAAIRNVIINAPDNADRSKTLIDRLASAIGLTPKVRPSWIDLVLIYLPEPTTQTKKDLRYVLDQSDVFRGEDRFELLRRMLPIIAPNGHRRPPLPGQGNEFLQFDDDLIYFRDNFHGVAFWPLPSQDSSEFPDVKNHIEARMVEGAELGTLAAFGASGWRQPVCQVICPNRKLLHVAFFALAATTLLVTVAGLASCRVRTRLAPFKVIGYIVSGGLLVLIALLLLACDPSFRQIGDALALLAVLAIVAILAIARIRSLGRGPIP